MTYPILSVDDFHGALRQRLKIVITDTATGIRLHRHPSACPYVQQGYFVQKVITNGGRHGGNFGVADEVVARQTWPGVTACQACA
jgi:hypothetical protein